MLRRRHVIHRRPADRGITACRGVDLSHDIPPISPRAAVLPERRLEQIAAELGEHADRVRERLSLADVVSLAIRAHRRQLGLSQRGYAAARGYSASHVARLERSAGDLRLAAVVDALRSTGFRLCDTGRARSFRFDHGHDGLAGIGARGAGRCGASAPRASSGRHRDDTAFVVVHQACYFSGDGPLWTWRRVPGPRL